MIIPDREPLERLRRIYAESLAQIGHDLSMPPSSIIARRLLRHGEPETRWFVVLSANLKALERDAETIAPGLRVPTLTEAVVLWMDGRLVSHNIEFGKRLNVVQREVNHGIQSRLDLVYTAGDPLLTAVSVLHNPRLITDYALYTGMTTERAQAVTDAIVGKAQPVALDAWELFRTPVEAVRRSMFHPSPLALRALEDKKMQRSEYEIR